MYPTTVHNIGNYSTINVVFRKYRWCFLLFTTVGDGHVDSKSAFQGFEVVVVVLQTTKQNIYMYAFIFVINIYWTLVAVRVIITVVVLCEQIYKYIVWYVPSTVYYDAIRIRSKQVDFVAANILSLFFVLCTQGYIISYYVLWKFEGRLSI